MQISILACESLGVRSLCCFVKTNEKKYLIDPGLALDHKRFGLRPHPFQIAQSLVLKRKILEYYKHATDIIISHYHGDHCPLFDAKLYQIDFTEIFPNNSFDPIDKMWYCKSNLHISKNQESRLHNLQTILKDRMMFPEGHSFSEIQFSLSVPHGTHPSHVMMTRIQDDHDCFVHASDIQMFHDETIQQIIEWQPTILFGSGPPIYLNLFSKQQLKQIEENIMALSKEIPIIIMDHHLLRSIEGIRFLNQIKKKIKNKIVSGADFMMRIPIYLESNRKQIYRDLPVDKHWFEKISNQYQHYEEYLKWKQYKIKKW